MADIHFHPFIAVLHPMTPDTRFYPLLPIRNRGGLVVARRLFAALVLSLWPPAVAFPCVFGHMRRRHSSHDSISPGAEASVKAARSLRAAQRAKRLDGRWNGGYFAADAKGNAPLRLARLSEPS
jgi:hypothetical protein